MTVRVQYKDGRFEWLPWRQAIQRHKELSDSSIQRLIDLSFEMLDRNPVFNPNASK